MSVQEINVDELAEALAAGARLIDVREPFEFAQARVAESVLLPMGMIPSNVDEFAGDQPAYVICRSGARSYRVCQFLAEHGVVAINVTGGMIAWAQSGHPIASGDA